jgi:uncharacterized protein
MSRNNKPTSAATGWISRGEAVFDHPVVTKEDSRMAYGEQRINLLGWWRDRVVHMTYTERGEDLHVISLREATKHEARYYFKAISDEA